MPVSQQRAELEIKESVVKEMPNHMMAILPHEFHTSQEEQLEVQKKATSYIHDTKIQPNF